MQKTDRKVLEQKLYVAIEKALVSNKAEFKNKTEDAVHKYIKKIAKKVAINKVKKIVNPKKKLLIKETHIDGFELVN